MPEKTIFIPQIGKGIDIQYLIGENAKDNFRIIDIANPNDIWFHVEDKPSSHIIALLPADTPLSKKDTQYIIKQGAVLCKQYSKYASEKKLSIIYTNIHNVKKTEIPGSVETTMVKRVVI